MSKLYSVSILCLISFLFACKKEDPEINVPLPEKSQEGLNTFGFHLNKKSWVSDGKRVCLPWSCHEALFASYNAATGQLGIVSARYLKNDSATLKVEQFALTVVTDAGKTGTYSLKKGDLSYGSLYRIPDNTGYRQSHVDPDFTVIITKLDTVQKIVSGEFYGKLFRKMEYSLNGTYLNDSLVVSDGRFDVKY